MSYAKHSFGGVQWELQDSMRGLCTSILQSGGPHTLNSAEDLLVIFIVAVASGVRAPFKSLYAYLREINPATPSALTLGYIYSECGLYGEAATLLSWGWDYSGQKPQADSIKCLLCCFQKLQLMDEHYFNALIGELENTSYWGNKRKGRAATGAWAVVQDVRFKDCQRIVREREEATQGIKKRFYDCLTRNGRDDFHNVDAIWGTMLRKKYSDE